MNKITNDEQWILEKGLELMHSKMAEIETKLAKIENGDYDADEGEIEAIKERLEDEYKRLEKSADLNAHILRTSFVSSKFEDMPAFDYQLSEMK